MWQEIKNIYHLFIGLLANVYFGYPSKKLTVIGVTGTDGKTTTVKLIYQILNYAGFKTAMISSTGAYINGEKYDIGFHVTTPDAYKLQNLIRKAVDKGCKYIVIEVTSHAIDQNRDFGIPYSVSVLTNITNEHLDYHKNYQKYLKTKLKLIKSSEKFVINKDDKSYEYILDPALGLNFKNGFTYGFDKNADFNLKKFDITNTIFLGEYNKYNLLAAISCCVVLGINEKVIKDAIPTLSLPVGRANIVYNGEFKVMIDFAHTPNSFEMILKSIKSIVKGRIIHVFGSAGERDKSKRPVLGNISSKYSDVIILTAEDPRGENVYDIIKQIKTGIKNKHCEVIELPDRAQAIARAIGVAQKNDLVLITGKAQESSMNFGKSEEPWDEFKVTKEAINEKINES